MCEWRIIYFPGIPIFFAAISRDPMRIYLVISMDLQVTEARAVGWESEALSCKGLCDQESTRQFHQCPALIHPTSYSNHKHSKSFSMRSRRTRGKPSSATKRAAEDKRAPSPRRSTQMNHTLSEIFARSLARADRRRAR